MNNLVVYLAYIAYKMKYMSSKWQRGHDVYSFQQHANICLVVQFDPSIKAAKQYALWNIINFKILTRHKNTCMVLILLQNHNICDNKILDSLSGFHIVWLETVVMQLNAI
jgi:hypothetical protein